MNLIIMIVYTGIMIGAQLSRLMGVIVRIIYLIRGDLVQLGQPLSPIITSLALL